MGLEFGGFRSLRKLGFLRADVGSSPSGRGFEVVRTSEIDCGFLLEISATPSTRQELGCAKPPGLGSGHGLSYKNPLPT